MLFLAGRYGDAAGHLAEAGGCFAARGEPEATIATYFLAQCRVETGDVSGAVEAFEAVVAAGHDPAGPQDIERRLDALFSLMRLYGVTRRRDAFRNAADSARALIARRQPENAEELLAETEGYSHRSDRLLAPSWFGLLFGMTVEGRRPSAVNPPSRLLIVSVRHGGLVTAIKGYMALNWKLVIDSTDAPALADFWAAALDYEVENPEPLIERLLAAGHLGEDAVVEHRGRKLFRGYAAVRHPDDPFDETSGVGHGRRILFHAVPESKTIKNRLHVDVHSEPGDRDNLVDRLEKLGATRVREVNQGPAGHWWVMQDPQGNEFCVT
ncbi:VOC family protein [Actinocorallia libanotica]|uniref:Glyoxalase-like domain-containing protein n=1 Tax=Actinocorallia libanotica TaxID=46162 RepID=A0ABN1R932_9ACTN